MSNPPEPTHAPKDHPEQAEQVSELTHWPLKFKFHEFGAYCFSAYGCRVRYGNYYPQVAPDDVLAMSSDTNPKYPDNLEAGWGPVVNFPKPAIVTWRSSDGASHSAEVDIGEIFKDELIRHKATREELSQHPDGALPGIILEVNDRTINVYMRAMLFLRKPLDPNNKYSNFRDDIIKVYSRTY